ncbi:MAG: capsular biosynthesis protein CpsF [Porphyromonadaceae bacterium]|nr:capsular biosynthesis protein CpsF [Porphyromonadaceae bacterium]
MKKQEKEIRVMFICNEGGHYDQMMDMQDLFSQYDTVLVTDNQKASSDKAKIKIRHTKLLTKKGFLQKRIARLFTIGEALSIYKEYRPDIMISTGANLAFPFFIVGWFHHCKLIYIESRARVYTRSLTGKLIARLCDKMYVQWPEQLKVYKNAEYYGTLV